MAIIWADNFKQYGAVGSGIATRMLEGIYSEADVQVAIEDPDVTETGAVIEINSGGTDKTLRLPLPGGAISTGGCSLRLWMPILPITNYLEIIAFRDAANTAQVTLAIDTTGAIHAFRGTSGGTLLGSTSTPVITASGWHHIEAKVLISDTVGTVEVRVNGVAKLTLTGIDTKNTANTTYAQLGFANDTAYSTFGRNFFMKDLVVWDTTGTQNNDFLGTVSVFTLLPDSDVAFPWTPSTGTTGWNLIDELAPNDTDFISAADPPPALSEFTLTNLPPDIVGIKALIPVVRARKIDGGDGNIQVGLKGTLTDLGADRPITSASTYWWDVSELSPDTGVSWTPVEVDAAKLTIDRTV